MTDCVGEGFPQELLHLGGSDEHRPEPCLDFRRSQVRGDHLRQGLDVGLAGRVVGGGGRGLAQFHADVARQVLLGGHQPSLGGIVVDQRAEPVAGILFRGGAEQRRDHVQAHLGVPVHADRERVFGVLGVLDVRPGQQDPVPHDVVLAGGPGFRVVLFQRQHADGERVVPEAALGGTYPDDRDRVAARSAAFSRTQARPVSVRVRVPPCVRGLPGVEQPLPLSASRGGPPEPQFAASR